MRPHWLDLPGKGDRRNTNSAQRKTCLISSPNVSVACDGHAAFLWDVAWRTQQEPESGRTIELLKAANSLLSPNR